jgi:8-oxo-dGTP pyrophosphatase MutT (NUDIX family)
MSLTVVACPHCARPDEQPLICGRCAWRWYANPKPAAGVILERDSSVLLLRRAVEPGLGAWDLPAGYLDPGESPEEAARRETREESGLEIDLVRLIGVYTSRPGNAVACIYLARLVDPSATVRLDRESSEFAWVRRTEVIDWLPRLAFGSMAAALSDWRAGRSGEPQP